jgi:uncharacterized membrane protein YoaK (UPF0700 family)
MSDVAADQLFERILRSLKENSAEFARKKRAQRSERIRQIVYVCVIFASGIVLGALLTKVL